MRPFWPASAFVLVGAFVFVFGITRPLYNWDVIGYVGAVEALGSGDTLQVHTSTYAEIGRVEGTEHYAAPGPTDTQYRVLMRTSPGAFAQTLRSYKVRVAYVYLVSILARLGMNIVFATHCISAVAAAFGIWLLFLIARRLLSPPFQLVLPLIALLLGLPETAGMSTPDGLAFALVLASVYLFLRDSSLLLFLLPLLVTVRTDLIAFILLMSVSLFVLWKTRRLAIGLSLLFSIILYFAVNYYAGYPGWRSAFTFTFIDRMASPDLDLLGLREYGMGVLKGMWAAVHNVAFLIFSACSGAAVVLAIVRWKGRRGAASRSDRILHLLSLSMLFVFIRLLVFPLPDARFFIAPYLLTVAALLALARGAIEGNTGIRVRDHEWEYERREQE